MAKAITHQCQSCGGPLNVSAKGGKYTCPFCGTINLFEPEQKPAGEAACPKCGALNPKDAVHCSECGETLVFSCPKCGAENSTGSPYCIRCGVNFQEEKKHREAAEASRLLQESLKKQQASVRRKRALIVFLVVLVISCSLCALITYATQYSPSARATATAEMAAAQQATLDTTRLLEEQYPYHGSNDHYTVYLQSFCIGQDKVTKDWYVISHFLFYPNRTDVTFDWNFEKSYLTDDLGNHFPVTYESSYSDHGRVDTAIDPNATSATLHIQVKVTDLAEIPIEIDLSDPLLTGNCGN